MNRIWHAAAATLLLWFAWAEAQPGVSGAPTPPSTPRVSTVTQAGQAPVLLSPLPAEGTPRQVIRTAQQGTHLILTLAGPGPSLHVLYWPAHLLVSPLRGQWMTLRVEQRPDGAATALYIRPRKDAPPSVTLLFGLRPSDTFPEVPVLVTSVDAGEALIGWAGTTGGRAWTLRPGQSAAAQMAGRSVCVTLEAIQPVLADYVERGRIPVVTGYRAFLSLWNLPVPQRCV